jgi:hypothetical protein
MNDAGSFVIVRRDGSDRRRKSLLVLGWLCSLALAFALGLFGGGFGLVPLPSDAEAEDTNASLAELQARLERLRQRNQILKRSDDISRAANQSLQSDLADRDERIASLEADVAFYERLVGGSAARQGLAIHSLQLRQDSTGAHHFRLTLTQNVKRTQLSRGEARLSIEGVQEGQRRVLDWPALRQDESAAPLEFAFKYFQQVEGIVMLPEGFAPHSVRVQLEGEAGRVERSIPWPETQASDEIAKQGT